MTDTPHIYVPEDRDELRDGLYRGFWAHRKAAQPAKKEDEQ